MNDRAVVLDVAGMDEIGAEPLRAAGISGGGIVMLRTNKSLRWACDGILEDYATLSYDAAEYFADIKVKLDGLITSL